VTQPLQNKTPTETKNSNKRFHNVSSTIGGDKKWQSGKETAGAAEGGFYDTRSKKPRQRPPQPTVRVPLNIKVKPFEILDPDNPIQEVLEYIRNVSFLKEAITTLNGLMDLGPHDPTHPTATHNSHSMPKNA
jgi:hypothetical protein